MLWSVNVQVYLSLCTPIGRIEKWSCGGHHGLAHPLSQDSLFPIRHLLINIGTFASYMATGKLRQCV